MSSQAPTVYNVTNRWDVKYIPLGQVLMTKPISTAVKASGGSISGMGFKTDPNAAPAPLNRMVNDFHQTPSMIASMQSGTKLPPMEVTLANTVGGTPYYSVDQGRHRFASSIVAGYTHVPAIVRDSHGNII
jgi:hypothetical protein